MCKIIVKIIGSAMPAKKMSMSTSLKACLNMHGTLATSLGRVRTLISGKHFPIHINPNIV